VTIRKAAVCLAKNGPLQRFIHYIWRKCSQMII